MRRDWKRLASYVISRRVHLGYRERREFADALHISDRTIGNLERGQSVSDSTLAAVEELLKWKPGSAWSVLEGGEPTDANDDAPAADDNPYTDPLEREIWNLTALPEDERRAYIELMRERRRAAG